MTKKINSTGKNLSLTKDWKFSLQCFANLNFLFCKHFSFLYLFNFLFLKLFIFNSQPVISEFKILVFTNSISLICTLFSWNQTWLARFNSFFKQLWKNSFFKIPINIFFFGIKNFYFSYYFLKDYVLFLTKKFTSPKKIFNLMFLFLTKNLMHISLFYSNKGLLIKQFLGFKLKLTGRYETSKTSMAKKILLKSGNVSATDLKVSIQFVDYPFYTKLGISNFKIWLFYKTLK